MKNGKKRYDRDDLTAVERDIQNHFWNEYKEYVENTPMTSYERRLLRDWVSKCHSVYEDPGSKYLCDQYPPRPFLDAYREDRRIEHDMKGMSKVEKEAYLKDYMGYEEMSPEETALEDASRNASGIVRDHVRRLERKLFCLWEFVWQEGLGDEAVEFIEDHEDEPVPFEW